MSRSRLLILVCILLVGTAIAIWAAVSVNDDDEEMVALADVPASVLEAANKAVTGGEVTAVEKEDEDGEIIYDVEKVVDGVEYEIEVTAGGVVNEVEKEGDEEDDDADDDEDEEVALSDVPASVIEAANKAVPGGKIEEVEMEEEDGKVSYEVEKVVDGVEYDIKVTADGVVKEVEEEDDEEEDDD